jgi:uncharacterized membrane protein YsdA (DUF1294 family)
MRKKHTSPFILFLGLAVMLTTLFLFFIDLFTTRIIAYLLAVNLSTFLLYGYDKFIASHSGIRVPENILHLLSLLGGSPAALVSQHIFHHKTAKKSFQWIFWAIVFVQGTLLWYLKVF